MVIRMWCVSHCMEQRVRIARGLWSLVPSHCPFCCLYSMIWVYAAQYRWYPKETNCFAFSHKLSAGSVGCFLIFTAPEYCSLSLANQQTPGLAAELHSHKWLQTVSSGHPWQKAAACLLSVIQFLLSAFRMKENGCLTDDWHQETFHSLLKRACHAGKDQQTGSPVVIKMVRCDFWAQSTVDQLPHLHYSFKIWIWEGSYAVTWLSSQFAVCLYETYDFPETDFLHASGQTTYKRSKRWSLQPDLYCSNMWILPFVYAMKYNL